MCKQSPEPVSRDCSGHGPPCGRNGTLVPLCPEERRYRVPGPESQQPKRRVGLGGGFPSCPLLCRGVQAAGLPQSQLGSRGGWPGAPSHPVGQACPSHAVSCEQNGRCQRRVNTRAFWGGSTPLAAFWKDEGFTSLGLLVPQKGIGRLTFHPCFFTPAFSLPLSGWGGLKQLLCSTPKAAAAFAVGERLL